MAQAPATAPGEAKASDVIATVNGVDITRKELNYLYARNAPPNLPPEVAFERKKAILADLIRNEALAQKAIEQMADKTDEFAIEMQLARRAALALRAERAVVSKAPQVTAQTAFDFVNKNPRMFSERQLLTLERMDMTVKEDGLLDRLDKATDSGASMDKLERQARESRSDTRRQILSIYSDQFPPELVAELLRKPYHPVIIKFENDKGRGSALYVHSAVPSPLVGQQAVQAAGNLLASKQIQTLRQQATDALIATTKISFQGEFSGAKLPAPSSENPGLDAARIFAKPVSLTRKLAIGAGLTAAAALAVLTLLTAWRYWFGIGSGSGAGGLRRACQKLPMIGGWFGKTETAQELARVLSSSGSNTNKIKASWPARVIMMLGLAGCGVAAFMQAQAALGMLAQWQLGAFLVAGLAAGLLLSWIYVNTSLSATSRKRRWLPVSISGLLLLSASAAGIALR